MNTSRVNVLIYRDLFPDAVGALEREFPSVNFRVVRPPHLTGDKIAWPEVVYGNVPAAWAVEAPSLRWLQIVSSGIDDYTSLAKSTVGVTTAQDIHASITAQHVLMAVLMFERGQPFFTRAAQDRTCELFGYNLEIHTANTPLLDVANLHVACASANTTMVEVHHPVFRFGLTQHPFDVGPDGCVHLPPGTGLGVELDWNWIDQHTSQIRQTP